MEDQRDTAMAQHQGSALLTSKQYAKLADWGERAALVALGSLVVQRIVEGASVTSASVVVGALVTGLAYFAAYHWLKQAK